MEGTRWKGGKCWFVFGASSSADSRYLGQRSDRSQNEGSVCACKSPIGPVKASRESARLGGVEGQTREELRRFGLGV